MKNILANTRLNTASALTVAIVPLMLISAASGQTADGKEQPKPESAAVPIDVFQGVRAKSVSGLSYPHEELESSREGWVNLNFMVDPAGKPYELMVAQSSGNKEFEKEALRAAKNWTFEPASLNGQPIDSAMTYKVKFVLSTRSDGANPDFVRAYDNLIRAIKKNDKAAADVAMNKLKVNNLYEDAYYGAAQYQYELHWGTETGQLAGLRRAVAEEKNAHYLPKDAFAGVLQSLLVLEIKARDFAPAMLTWEKLQHAGVDKTTLDKIKPSIEQIATLRQDGRMYSIAGAIDEESWNLLLFKKHFFLKVSAGHVSQVKLRCDTKYVFFQFDPQLQYQVNDKYGTCSVQVIGDPGTKFDFFQL